MTKAETRAPTILGIFDDPRYAAMARSLAQKYSDATPFRHVAIDDFLPRATAEMVEASLPTAPGHDWITRNSDNNRRTYQHDETQLPGPCRELLREFATREFVLFLETLTGIEGLIPDPYLLGGGLQYAGRGDFLAVHADWNWHHKLQLNRRVNALLYLTPNWQHSWGGALELFSKDGQNSEKALPPEFNRLTVFSTGADTFHGHPHPLACPEGVWRRAINLYFYTVHPDGDQPDPGFTRYAVTASPLAMELGEGYRAKGDAYSEVQPSPPQT